jgi:hypothetical protein
MEYVVSVSLYLPVRVKDAATMKQEILSILCATGKMEGYLRELIESYLQNQRFNTSTACQSRVEGYTQRAYAR